jgi:hypothetical protein
MMVQSEVLKAATVEAGVKAMRSFCGIYDYPNARDKADAALVTAIYEAMNASTPAVATDEGVVLSVALAIERADNDRHTPEGTIDHPEVSSWGEHLARAAIIAMAHQP